MYAWFRSYCGGFLGAEPQRAFGWRECVTRRFYRGGFLGAEPARAFGWRVYVSFRFYRGRFLDAEPARARHGDRAGKYLGYSCTLGSGSTAGDFSAQSLRGHLAGAYMFRSGSTAGDFSTNARNDRASGLRADEAVGRAGRPRPCRITCTLGFVPTAGDFSAQSLRGQGTVTVRASVQGIRVRLLSFLMRGISRLTLEMTGRPV